MSMLERLRRGAGAKRHDAPGRNGAPKAAVLPGLELDTFEYVRVGRTALARASGRWTEDAPPEGEFALVVSAPGESRQRVRSIGDTPGTTPPAAGEWRAAFPLTLEVVEHESATFELETPLGTMELSRPIMRALYMHEAREAAEELGEDLEAPEREEEHDLDELESRVREAEAGLRWTQGQLARERDRRRELEQEIETLRAEAERLQTGPDRLAALEAEVEELRGERERREALEAELRDATAKLERLKEFEGDARIVAEERARREAMERQLSELAVDREKVRTAEERIAQLSRELEEAREGAAKLEAERAQLHDDLIRVRAESEATIKRLDAELDAVRRMWVRPGEAAPEPEPEPELELEPELEPEAEPELLLEDPEDVVTDDLVADAVEAADVEQYEDDAAPPLEGEPADGAMPCADCDATGACARCDGKGKRFGLRCSECGGTGLCPTCGGPGYVWEEEAAAS